MYHRVRSRGLDRGELIVICSQPSANDDELAGKPGLNLNVDRQGP